MKKINIININFDIKTKIVLGICIIIAISIISYSFYIICIKGGNNELISNKNLEYYTSAQEYETNFEICVNSNKNSNTYSVFEQTNIPENRYFYRINESLEISIDSNEIKISKENIDYKYTVNILEEYNSNNFISFSSIIKIVNGIQDNSIKGNIKRVVVNEKIIYEIRLEEEYVKKIKRIDIIMSQNEDNIEQIVMYDLDEKEKYFVTISSFIVKK